MAVVSHALFLMYIAICVFSPFSIDSWLLGCVLGCMGVVFWGTSESTATALFSFSSIMQPHEQFSLPLSLYQMLCCLDHKCLPMAKDLWVNSWSIVHSLAALERSIEKDSVNGDMRKWPHVAPEEV